MNGLDRKAKWRWKLAAIPALMAASPVAFWVVFARWPRGWEWAFHAVLAVVLGLLSRPKRRKRAGTEEYPRISTAMVQLLLLLGFMVVMTLALRWLL